MLEFAAIGTRWQIAVKESVGEAAWGQLERRIHERIEEFDAAYSRFRLDSLVAQMARAPGRYDLPSDGYRMLAFYHRLYQATGGKVTPLIGQAMSDAGYDADYSFRPRKLQAPPRWERVLAFTRADITLQQPALLDFGAAGKGYLIDIVGRLIEAAGIESYIIHAGGDILHRGNAIRVGLENPFDTTEIVGTVQLVGKSLCASAPSRRVWEGYHHIIDPDRLQSPQTVAATWVIADDAMTADGLATALFFVSPEQLRRSFSFEYAVLYPDMTLKRSAGFGARVLEAAA